MTPYGLMNATDLKKTIRETAHANRSAQADKDGLSRQICDKFTQLDEFARASTVMVYIDARSEVRTRHNLPAMLASGKRIVVPYCVEGLLELYRLENMDELAIGMYKILEPKP